MPVAKRRFIWTQGWRDGSNSCRHLVGNLVRILPPLSPIDHFPPRYSLFAFSQPPTVAEPTRNTETHKSSKYLGLRKPRPAKFRIQSVGLGKELRAQTGEPVDWPADHSGCQRLFAPGAGGGAPGVVQREEAEHNGEGDSLAVVESAVLWVDMFISCSGTGPTLRVAAIAGYTGASRSYRRWGFPEAGRWRRE